MISAINSRSLNGRKLGSVSVAFSFFILTFLVASMQITDGHDWGDDFAEYIQQGISIVNGTYASVYLKQGCFFIYPHGFPLLIAAVYTLFGFNLLAFKMINVVMYAVFVSILFYFCDKKLTRITALVIAFLFAFSPCLFLLVDCILSDTVALTFTFIALVCIVFLFDEADGRGAGERETAGRSGIATGWKMLLLSCGIGFFSFCSYVCRDSGIVLLCTLACVQFLRFTGWGKIGRIKDNRKPDVDWYGITAAILPYIVFAVFTFLLNYVLFPPTERKQLGLFHYLSLSSVSANVVYYFGLISRFFYPQFIWFALFPAVFWAMAKFLQKDYVFVIYFLGIMALYIIWPIGGQGIRYIVSALPIILFFAGRAAELLYESASCRPLFVFNFCSYGIIALFSCLSFLSVSVMNGVWNVMSGRYLSSGSFTEEAKEMYRYIDKTIADDGRIYFFKPRLLLMVTGNAAVYISPESGQSATTATAAHGDALGFDYYLHTFDRGYGQLLTDEQAREDSFRLGESEFSCIHGNEKMRLFQRQP